MTDFLLLLIALTGAKVPSIDSINVSRYATLEACESAGVAEAKKIKHSTFTCFEVAALPGRKRLEPVQQPKK